MRIAKRDRPPIDLHLVTAEVTPGDPWLRFMLAQHPDPLGYGRGCKSRFADAELDQRRPARFEPLYFGSTFRSCFVETVLRDRASWRLAFAAKGIDGMDVRTDQVDSSSQGRGSDEYWAGQDATAV